MTTAPPPDHGPIRGDAYGRLLEAYHRSGEAAEVIERDDGFVSAGMDAFQYFRSPEDWPTYVTDAFEHVRGRVLDVGCGAGQHALALQDDGHDVVGIDSSPGAVEVSRDRGVETVRHLGIEDVDRLGSSFDTVVMMGNNFGLVENADRAAAHLASLARLTGSNGTIIAESRDPYQTDREVHLSYHERNRTRGALPGRLIIRARYERYATDWFEYLMVSPDEMGALLEPTSWSIETRYEADEGPQYIAILTRS